MIDNFKYFIRKHFLLFQNFQTNFIYNNNNNYPIGRICKIIV